MQCNICSRDKEVIEMTQVDSLQGNAKCFICPECGSITYISILVKQNELNNFA